MLTLEQININEQELDQILNFIFENGDHPEKEMYLKFIKEDATLDQKLVIATMEATDSSGAKVRDPSKQGHMAKAVGSVAGQLFGPFWLAYRVIRAFTDKCSRKCKVIGTNTFIRQKCMAGCSAQEASKSLAAVAKIQCKGDAGCETKKKSLQDKWSKKAAEAKAKHERYAQKHKKLAFTI
jgi:hypothetical protein